MDLSHGQEIHYHLAKPLMHLNSIAGFLPFFEPAVDWDESEMSMYRRPGSAPPKHLSHCHQTRQSRLCRHMAGCTPIWWLTLSLICVLSLTDGIQRVIASRAHQNFALCIAAMVLDQVFHPHLRRPLLPP